MLPGLHIPMLGGGGGFPFVLDIATSVFPADTSPVTVSLPSGIVSGNLIIVGLGIESGRTIDNWDTTKDFTELLAASNGNIGLNIAYRIADGTEGSTVEFTYGGTGKPSAHFAYLIGGHSGNAPELASAFAGSTNPNPPNIIPSWGAKPSLILAVAGNESVTTTGDPADYTDGFGENDVVFVRTAQRLIVATSEDPGVFTNTTNQDWFCATIAIEGA